MLAYPINLTPDTNGTLLVGFPDIPEANAVGENEQDAIANAVDALETALALYLDEGRPIPVPSRHNGHQVEATLSASSSAKVLLWNEMLAKKLRKDDLARLLGVDVQKVELLFDLGHSTHIEFVERAAQVLGKHLTVELS